MEDRTLGGLLLSLNICFFTYYTLWTLVTPLLPATSPLLILFPFSREWAVRLPCLILLIGLCFVGMLTGLVIVETAQGQRRTSEDARPEKRKE
ncbi:hypothetical protein JCM11641_005168 [Rhodosporidiobolus odoratus]